MNAAEQFREAIRAAGLTPPDAIEAGRFHRFPGAGKRNGNRAGWCKLFPDGMGGVFGDYSRDFAEQWQARLDRPLTLTEREGFRQHVERARAEAEATRRDEHAQAALKAEAIWQAAPLPSADSHPYLTRKAVKAHGLRLHNRLLVVPMRDATGALHSLQFIDSDGTKRFLTGGRKAGCYHAIGKPGERICIAEGYATAASVHEATSLPVAVAFDCGNLRAVAEAIKAKHPAATLVFCADDDAATDGNPGATAATDAARAVGGLVALPDFGADRPEGATDFNDLAAHRGREAVERAIANANPPQVSEGRTETPNATAGDSDGARVELVCATDVKPEPVRWLWRDWLAAGKLHILAGPPGTGKTTLALALAATITSGGRWPNGPRADPGDVVVWSGEDGVADTLAPRLLVNGADPSRVRFVGSVAYDDTRRPFDPATDTPALALALARLPNLPALLIVDPIVSAVAGDSHKNSETRRSLQPLVDLGDRIGCAILGISHYSKGTAGRDPVERVTGSIAFGALPRVVLAAVKTTTPEGNPGPRLFARAKSNNGPDGGGFHYSLQQVELPGESGIFASHILWGDPVEGEARALLAAAEADATSEDAVERRDAAAWLRNLLADGPMPAKDVRRHANDAGHAWRTVQRAMREAGVESRRAGFGQPAAWALAPQSRQSRQPSKVGANGANGVSCGATDGPGEVF